MRGRMQKVTHESWGAKVLDAQNSLVGLFSLPAQEQHLGFSNKTSAFRGMHRPNPQKLMPACADSMTDTHMAKLYVIPFALSRDPACRALGGSVCYLQVPKTGSSSAKRALRLPMVPGWPNTSEVQLHDEVVSTFVVRTRGAGGGHRH